jgi:hypothetical protein
MSRSFTSIIWVWNFDGEERKVDYIYSLGNALADLTLSQTQQVECSYDWIYDDLYLPFFSAYDDFLLGGILLHAPLDLQSSLSQISQSFDDLYEPDKEGFNRDIIEGVRWNKIRSLSREALLQMEWEELLTYHDDLYYSRNYKSTFHFYGK